jgi:Arc/MetJ-type ribon-helix-helix transcriptional regulator
MPTPAEMNLVTVTSPDGTTRLEPMLVRLPPSFAAQLRNLARRTRVRQSDYLREAVADLLAKYGESPIERESM